MVARRQIKRNYSATNYFTSIFYTGSEISCMNFSKITRFLERSSVEHIELISNVCTNYLKLEGVSLISSVPDFEAPSLIGL